MKFEIISYGGGDFLRLIFNGIAQIFGNNDYLVAIKSTVLLGFIGILLAAAFQKGKVDTQWILGVILINMTLIVPKTNIIITDNVIPANSAVVENVPIGISATATLFNRFGDWLTRSFETVFSLPNQIKYTNNGLLFAQTLVEESTNFEFTDPRLSSNLSDFWKNCVFYDILLNRYSWSDVIKSDNLVDFFSKRTSQNRAFTYENSKRERVITVCQDGFNNSLIADIKEEEKSISNINGGRLLGKLTDRGSVESINRAISKFESAMPVAYQYLTNLTLSQSNIITQNVMANSFKRGLVQFATDIDSAAAAEDFSLAKAEAERRTTFSVMGKLAKKMLPILHNIFESLIYAIFPIVMVLAMLPNAINVLLKYAQALLWINLWPPLYAILHFGVTYHSQKAATMAMVHSGLGFATGLSIMTNTELGNVLSDYAAITGYLSLSIPMISWLVIMSSGSMMASLAGRLMDGYERPVSGAASEATSGNISLGQYNYQNQSAFQSNIAPQTREGTMSYQGASGINNTTTEYGNYYSIPSSSSPLSLNLSSNIGNSIRESYNEAKSQEHSTMMDNLQSTAFLSSLKNSSVDHINNSKYYSEGLSETDRHFLSHSSEKSQNLLNQYAKNIGLNDNVAKALRSHVEGSGGVGGNLKIAELGAKLNGQFSLGKEHISSEQIGRMLQFMTSRQYNEAQSEEASTAKDILHKLDSSEGKNKEHSLTDALDKHQQISLKHANSVSNLEQVSNQKEKYEQTMGSINQSGVDGLIHWMTSKKGIHEDYATDLISKANKGDYTATKEINSHAKSYIDERLKESGVEIPKFNDHQDKLLNRQYKNESSSFENNHAIKSNLHWADQEKYDNVEKRVFDTFKNPDLHKNRISNHHDQTKKEMRSEGDKLKEEYNEDLKNDSFFKSTKTKRVDEFKEMLQ